MQQTQLDTLRNLTGVDFAFIPQNKNKFGVKYYEHKCNTDAEYHKIAGQLNQYEDILYTCVEHPDNTCSIVITENQIDQARIEAVTFGKVKDNNELKPIGKLNGNDIFLDIIPTTDGSVANITMNSNRAIVVVNINGMRLPFYVSSGLSGKEQEYGIASEKWYPLQGISTSGWLNKMPDMQQNPYPELDEVCKILEQKFPAAQYKAKALNHQLPIAQHEKLMKYANSSFPEGLPVNENGGYAYIKNNVVYLPHVINAWRSKPNDFLNINDGIMAVKNMEILRRVHEMDVICPAELEDDVIWFNPTLPGYHKSNETNSDVMANLLQQGVNINTVVTADNKNGFGIPVRTFKDLFDTKSFKNATKKLSDRSATTNGRYVEYNMSQRD